MTRDLTNPVTQVSLNHFNPLLFEKGSQTDFLGEVRFRFDHQALVADRFANHDTGLFAISGLDDSELVLLETGNRFGEKLPVANRLSSYALSICSMIFSRSPISADSAFAGFGFSWKARLCAHGGLENFFP
jgi:hypothetical protein